MRFEKWNIGTAPDEAVALLQDAQYPRLLSLVLASRGIVSPEQAMEALERERTLSLSPFLMKDMDKAVTRIQQAIDHHETVAVFGDYDVDGITSTCLVTDYLRRAGVPTLRYIPSRLQDGYGLNKDALFKLKEQGATLMITVDCGITGNEEIDFANSIDLDVVVTDHHECKDRLPNAVAVVNPHRPDCGYPFKHLAGVGVALNLVLALGGDCQRDALFSRYCALAAIGTVADVMLMEGENRTIVYRGLESLPHTDFVGIHALLKEAGLTDKPITSIQIGFVLSPRINAAGRMGKADLAADLLETSDPARAQKLAKALCSLNRERQCVEHTICEDALGQIEQLPDACRNALVLASEDWHQGVVGIVASRLCERYSCPSFMIHLADGMGKGSCRSYGGFNLYAALEHCADLLDGFGGHELAAGFTIREENILPFRLRMNDFVRTCCGGEPPVSSLEIDTAIACPAAVTMDEVKALSMLEPFGAGNPRPVFALLGATVEYAKDVGQGKHLKLRLSRGNYRLDGIFFSATAACCGIKVGDRVDAAFYLQINNFRGIDSLQLQMIDLRPSRLPSHNERDSLQLVRRCVQYESLTPKEISRLHTSREQFAAIWRQLSVRMNDGTWAGCLLPLLRTLAEQAGGCEAFLRSDLALAVFEERGLLTRSEHGEQCTLSLLPVQEKVDLFACPYLKRLRDFPCRARRYQKEQL